MPQTSKPPIHGKVYCLGRYGAKVIDTLRQLDLENLVIQSVVPSCEAVYPLAKAPQGETIPVEEMGPDNLLSGREGMALLKLANTPVDEQLIVIVADLSERPAQIAANLLATVAKWRGAAATVALLRGSEERSGDEACAKTLESMKQDADLIVQLGDPVMRVEACFSRVCAEDGLAVLCDSPEVQGLIGRLVDTLRANA